MAIYHCSAKIISRSKGQSCVASAAYRSGDKLLDNSIDKVFDYNKKQGIEYSEIILPDNAPLEFADRETLWNAVENVEKAKDAQLAREIEVAIPDELDKKQQIDLVQNYGKYFAQQGMIVDLSIHDKNDGNPHCHIMLTMRPITAKGEFGAKSKKVYDLDREGNRIPVLDKKTGEQKKEKNGKKMWKNHKERSTEWDSPESLQKWRNDWEVIANQALEKAGRTERIDCRSLENQNINRAATIHEGYAARQIEKDGGVADRCEFNRSVKSANAYVLEIEKQINNLQKELNAAEKELMLLENKVGRAVEQELYNTSREIAKDARALEGYGKTRIRTKPHAITRKPQPYLYEDIKSIKSINKIETLNSLKVDKIFVRDLDQERVSPEAKKLNDLLYKEALYKGLNKTGSRELRELSKLIKAQERICAAGKSQDIDLNKAREMASNKATETLYNVLTHSQKKLETLYKVQTVLRHTDFEIRNKIDELRKASGAEAYRKKLEAEKLQPAENELKKTIERFDQRINELKNNRANIDREIETLEKNEPRFFKGGWREKVAAKNTERGAISYDINQTENARRFSLSRENEKIEKLRSEVNTQVNEYMRKNPAAQLARDLDNKDLAKKLNAVGQAITKTEKLICNITPDDGKTICRLTKDCGQAKGKGSEAYKAVSGGNVQPPDVSRLIKQADKDVQLVAHMENDEMEKDWEMMTEIEKDEKINSIKTLDRY